jgi:hypothetical protein
MFECNVGKNGAFVPFGDRPAPPIDPSRATQENPRKQVQTVGSALSDEFTGVDLINEPARCALVAHLFYSLRAGMQCDLERGSRLKPGLKSKLTRLGCLHQ